MADDLSQTASRPVAKMLVLEDDPASAEAIKRFCDEHHLVALKARRHRLMAVLRSNIDLGAVLLAENYGGAAADSAAVAQSIHALRPELPIILRRPGEPTLDGLAPTLREVVCAAFTTTDMAPLRAAVDEYLFSLDFPSALVRGICEITEARLGSLFRRLAVSRETAYIVRDRIIFGEVFSLIPLESAWCRGYMMMQVEEEPMLELIAQLDGHEGRVDFRDLNSLLGELTNLIWGAFKDRFMSKPGDAARMTVQVPLLVNHRHRYISFGSSNPQLCFKYRLTDEATGRSVTVDQRFVFSLNWLPEDFAETVYEVDALVDGGELELF
ncbi:chemotaxis protein CheX [Burkholderia sp. WAC0059]|uniref:chemotaxis protein CheX n=1 Tax=Burkholderia sp. WAC0059 TaxID=2066022 RepID=UPI000C7EA65C|nr:chemotaxis protein CheX [Burkholderia sp. WAC0059]PLZ02346.1 chemotaxis protein CheX [Burkholderia sp. WAC0059]